MLSRVVLMLSLLAIAARGVELTFDFSGTPEGQIPPGFRSALAGQGKPGEWRVVQDEVSAFEPLSDKVTSSTRRAVVGQFSADTTDERFPILLYDKETFSDFTLITKFKLVEGTTEQMAGIVFRVRDPQNFYVIRASGLGNNVRFYKMVAGQRTQPIGPELPVARRQWHELKIQCQGTRIRCWFNGREPFPPLLDSSFSSGKIGFWTKSDSVSYFAGATINYTPRESLAEVLVRETVKEYPRLLGLKIYVTGENGEPRVAASKDSKEVGSAGGETEKNVLATGQPYSGKGKGDATVVMPLRDRNGDPMAAVRIQIKSFPGQTEQNILARTTPIVKAMQDRAQSLEDLMQ